MPIKETNMKTTNKRETEFDITFKCDVVGRKVVLVK